MEPLSALALMVAQVGARRLVGALAGDDAGGLAAGVLGLLSQVEQSQSRLISLEQQMNAVLEQRYTVSLNNGTRLLKQSAMPGQAAAERSTDLDNAASSLMDAAHAARSPVQAAIAERQLLLVELKRGNIPKARAAWQNLDLHVGEAITRNHVRHEHPAEESRQRIADGEFGRITQLERFQTPDPRWFRAWDAVRRDARTAASELAALLADAVSGAELVGIDNGLSSMRSRFPRVPRGLSFGPPERTYGPVVLASSSTIALDVPLDEAVTVGGIEARLRGILSTGARPLDATGHLHELRAEVTAATERVEPIEVWVQADVTDLSDAQGSRNGFIEPRSVRPGEAFTVTSSYHHSPELPPGRIGLAVGGLLLSAALPNARTTA
ncbi:hypothetical protein [Promicromonospora sp. NPDC050249]|uniref:hypothetical protein n=1 Tax=Promicromonospora sp. NPDC050249 TaxID=3154743 RepID=UPI0033DDF4D9